MVIIKEDNLPVMKWPLARVVKTHPGDDDIVRVVEVKTANGLFKRPIHRLAPLPIEEDFQTTNAADNVRTDLDEEPKAKRKKKLLTHLTLTILAILFLLPLVCGTPVENRKFGTKLGIHFEQIGTAAISTTEWNIFVYYDLTTYWSEIAILINGTKSLQNLCNLMNVNETCLSIINHFEHMEDELRLENTLLRNRRGALDIVGNVAHSLFGILDSEYADHISDTIQRVKENESHLLNLFRNQTSIVDSTINIIRQNQLTAKARFEQLEQEIKTYTEQMQNIDNVLLQVHFTQLFNSGVLELTLIANNVQKIQSSILDTLMDTHHGQMSPLLLTPEQLQNEIDQIKLHSPASVSLPVTGKDELLQLFKLMKVQGRLTHLHAVFKITIPLVERELFKMFYLIPVPNIINNTMIAIKACTTFLGISESREQYILFTRSELSSCDVIKEDNFLCSNVQIRYNFGADMCGCEINLYNNKTTPTCILEKTTTNWIPLNERNKWIYATSSASRATAVCNRDMIHISLKGSGLLTLDPECMLKHNLVTVNGRQTITSSIRSSYTSLGKISDLSKQNNILHYINNNHSISTNMDELYANSMKELTTLQTSLKEQKIMDLPNELKYHQQHNHAIGYLALSLSLMTCFIICFRYYKNGKNRQNPHPTMPMECTMENIQDHQYDSENNVVPTPMPRQQVRRFILDV